MNGKKKFGFGLIFLVFFLSFIGFLISGPIPQDPGYHLFSDDRLIFGIPKFWNVISNLPFLLVGFLGLYLILFSTNMIILPELKINYSLFFLGVSLVSIGSAYYHLFPDNQTLVWDRIPMAIAFMALFSVILGEFLSITLGRLALWPLVTFGVFSVIFWSFTENNEAGDLRPYLLVQFIPMLLIPILLIFFNSKFTNALGYWILLLSYSIAKVFEILDKEIYSMFGIFSGHSIKHVVVAIGIAILLYSYQNREYRNATFTSINNPSRR